MAEVAATTSSNPALDGNVVVTRGDDISVPDFSLLTVGGDLRFHHDAVARELLDDGEQAGVEEAHLKEHEKRQRAVDAVGQRVEHRRGEIEPKSQFDERLHRNLLAVLLAHPL